MKKETFNETLRMYLDSEDEKALFILRLRSRKKAKQSSLSYSKNTLIRIKSYLKTKKYQKNDALEDQMISTTNTNLISTPQKDEVFIYHLKLEVDNKNIHTEHVKLLLYDDSGEHVKTHDLKWSNSFDIPLKGLQTGRYYWTLANKSIKSTGRFYHCTPIDAAFIRDSDF